MIGALKNPDVEVWDSLNLLLMGFSMRVVAKKYNSLKPGDRMKLEFVRLESIIYLCCAFNEMGIFEPDYAGETMLEEMSLASRCRDLPTLLNLNARLNNILSG